MSIDLRVVGRLVAGKISPEKGSPNKQNQHLADRFDRGMQPLQLIGFELQELMGSPNIADD